MVFNIKRKRKKFRNGTAWNLEYSDADKSIYLVIRNIFFIDKVEFLDDSLFSVAILIKTYENALK